MKSKNIVQLIFFSTFILFYNSALINAQSEGNASEAPPDQFVVAFSNTELQLDPHRATLSVESQVQSAIYEGLFANNYQNVNPELAVASSWKLSRDNLTYTFSIRENAKWSDGSSVKAADFLRTWMRAINPKERSDWASFFDVIEGAKDYRLGKNTKAASVGLRATADNKLIVKLSRPTAYFIKMLCHHAFSPIHSSMLAKKNWSDLTKLPCNGPYRITSFSNGIMLLDKNEKYWDADKVAISKLKFIFSDDAKSTSRNYDNGTIHWATSAIDYETLMSKSNILFETLFSTNYWFLNQDIEIFKNVDVRRALALALPWSSIRLNDGAYMPASTLVFPFDIYRYAKGINSQDVKTALSLLEKAGYKNINDFPEIVIVLSGKEDEEDANNFDSSTVGLMKAAWEKIGIKVRLDYISPDEYYQVIKGDKKREWSLGNITWIGDYADPMAFLQLWLSDSELNFAKHKDSKYDDMINKAEDQDGAQRLKALAEAETYLLETGSVLPIYFSRSLNVIDIDYIEGWAPNLLDIHPFKYLKFGKKKMDLNLTHNKNNDLLVYNNTFQK